MTALCYFIIKNSNIRTRTHMNMKRQISKRAIDFRRILWEKNLLFDSNDDKYS